MAVKLHFLPQNHTIQIYHNDKYFPSRFPIPTGELQLLNIKYLEAKGNLRSHTYINAQNYNLSSQIF